jgi:alginate O-acetyltransferase complex protein AlgI
MLFNSLTFLVFGAIFFAFWPVARKTSRARWGYLTIASFIFYGWWDWRFLFLIIASGLIDFFAGWGIAAFPRYKRILLLISLLGNVGSLVTFKYSIFLASSLERLLLFLGIDIDITSSIPPFMHLLPIGISFYTFQSMSYTIDIYRGALTPTRSLLHFFAYLSMFPQLVAGPIVRASELLPQLASHRTPEKEEQWQGLKLIVSGYFKKMVIADSLAPDINAAFASTDLSPSSLFWWAITTAFAFQIYCDFSGYSDIARGLAKWMGYDFLVNFDHPYIATSLRKFWTRWHISLSSWFRDYLYIPLGGGRAGPVRSHINMWITMIVSGIWHGAAWTFALWGILHAFFLSLERVSRWPDRLKRFPTGAWIACFLVIAQVWIAWVFFRAENLGQALAIIETMFSFHGPWITGLGLRSKVMLGVIILGEFATLFRPNYHRNVPALWRNTLDVVFLSLLIVACIYARGPGNEFIYFQF